MAADAAAGGVVTDRLDLELDESTADDGAIHDLWRTRIDPARVEVVRAILARLVIHRGAFDDDDRAAAGELAGDAAWPLLGRLPIVVEALAS